MWLQVTLQAECREKSKELYTHHKQDIFTLLSQLCCIHRSITGQQVNLKKKIQAEKWLVLINTPKKVKKDYSCKEKLQCVVNPFSPNSRSKENFSFQFIASYVWYSMENLAGDLLFGLKLVKLSILPTLHTLCLVQVGRIEVKILVDWRVKRSECIQCAVPVGFWRVHISLSCCWGQAYC